jgi:hypothetical protein
MPFQLNTTHVMLRCAMGWLVSHYPTIRRSPQPGSANPQTTPLSLFTGEPCRHARRCCLTPTRVCGAQHDAMHRRCRLYAGERLDPRLSIRSQRFRSLNRFVRQYRLPVHSRCPHAAHPLATEAVVRPRHPSPAAAGSMKSNAIVSALNERHGT